MKITPTRIRQPPWSRGSRAHSIPAAKLPHLGPPAHLRLLGCSRLCSRFSARPPDPQTPPTLSSLSMYVICKGCNKSADRLPRGALRATFRFVSRFQQFQPLPPTLKQYTIGPNTAPSRVGLRRSWPDLDTL